MTTPNENETAPAMQGCAHTTCSPSSDTPETDKEIQDVTIAAKAGDSLPLATAMMKKAKKLERERDKARKALREIAEIATRYSDSTLRTGVIKKVAAAGLSPENRQSGGTAPQESPKTETEEPVGGCPPTPCSASMSPRDLRLVQNVGKALKDGYQTHGVPVIMESTECGFTLRLGDPLNVSLVIGGIQKSEEPEIHVGSYHPSINGEATRAIFTKACKLHSSVGAVDPTTETPRHQLAVGREG